MFYIILYSRSFRFFRYLFCIPATDFGIPKNSSPEILGIAALLAIAYYYYTQVLLVWRSYVCGVPHSGAPGALTEQLAGTTLPGFHRVLVLRSHLKILVCQPLFQNLPPWKDYLQHRLIFLFNPHHCSSPLMTKIKLRYLTCGDKLYLLSSPLLLI